MHGGLTSKGHMVSAAGKEKVDDRKEVDPELSLEERLGGLKLQGEEEEDLDFSGEFEDLIKCTLVHKTKPFSHATLFSVMWNAWVAVKEVTFKVLKLNLFQGPLPW